ncbi:MAG: YeeE/YedE family protein [Deltaproteobacteria bacterium]|nr:YeeE/YedE family protein [Deltaproteobacteria bacterium]
MNKILPILTALASGLLFGAGLVLADMTNPGRVLNFLDVAGSFDPTLGFVMAGAIAVYAPLYWLGVRRTKPLAVAKFDLPTLRRVQPRLVLGSALFGLGWGLSGVCPGPALVVAGAGAAPLLLFSAAMMVGMVAYEVLEWLTARSRHETQDQDSRVPSAFAVTPAER